MPKRSMENLTESMFYVLMALRTGPMCGTDAAKYVEERTAGRVRIGPATLYTVLAKFENEKYTRQTEVDGRRRTYTITEKGEKAFQAELVRLRLCVADAEGGEEHEEDGLPAPAVSGV